MRWAPRRDRTYAVLDAPRYTAHVYRIGDAEHHVIVRDDLPRTRYGSGGVHHLALRIPASVPIEEWERALTAFGYRNSGIVDRHYFTSLYVREPNHMLYELATEGPGFEVDGPIDPDRLSLPPFSSPAARTSRRSCVPSRSTGTEARSCSLAVHRKAMRSRSGSS